MYQDLEVTTDWDLLKDKDLATLHELETAHGPVGSYTMLGGHHLVLKIEQESRSSAEGDDRAPIVLTGRTRRASIGNLSTILGLVLRSSRPYVSKHAHKRLVKEYDPAEGMTRPKVKWDIRNGSRVDSDVREGDVIVYNSYNVGQVAVAGLIQPLVIVRELDVMAVLPREELSQVELVDVRDVDWKHGDSAN